MKLEDFNYTYPESLIAQHPTKKRDQARLMVVDRETGSIEHDIFKNVAQYLPPQSMVVLNNSKVIPARLLGKRAQSGGEVEIFLLKQLEDGYHYETLLRPLKRLKVSEKISFHGNGLVAEIVDKDKRIVKLNKKNVRPYLEKRGHMPLPPYIRRQDNLQDRKDYQTVYAKNKGSVASPTAGLHFTKPLLNQIKKQGHAVETLTLHVSYGTFKPVQETDITKHQMHVEDYDVRRSTWDRIKQAKNKGQPIVAVGTTSCRTLETIAGNNKLSGTTNLFIYPGYPFKMIDALITNFHQPLSTLLMLVYAFGGQSLMKKAYQEAVKGKYRLFSYGDAMIIR